MLLCNVRIVRKRWKWRNTCVPFNNKMNEQSKTKKQQQQQNTMQRVRAREKKQGDMVQLLDLLIFRNAPLFVWMAYTTFNWNCWDLGICFTPKTFVGNRSVFCSGLVHDSCAFCEFNRNRNCDIHFLNLSFIQMCQIENADSFFFSYASENMLDFGCRHNKKSIYS